jgi:ribonuclease P protein component
MSELGTPLSKGRARARLSRSARLQLSGDFNTVFDNKTSIVGSLMVMWHRPTDSKSGLRLGVIASKRTFRRAVDRNRAKRLIREAFRLTRGMFASNSADLVIIARRRILGVKCANVERELRWLFRKAGFTPSQEGRR